MKQVTRATFNSKGSFDLKTLLSILIICILSVVMMLMPGESNRLLASFREFINQFSILYIVIGIVVFVVSIILAVSKYGKVCIGKPRDRPEYSLLKWGAMLFSATMSADILFWALNEWIYYYNEPYIVGMENKAQWALTYSMFHWGAVPWAFFIIPTLAFGLMIHTDKDDRLTLSGACKPALGRYSSIRGLNNVIDVISVVGLLLGTATTFSVVTPLLGLALSDVTGLHVDKYASIILLLAVTLIYVAVIRMKNKKTSSIMAQVCLSLLLFLLFFVLCMGPTRYIVHNSISSLENLVCSFASMALMPITAPTPMLSDFTENWTLFYWSYWLVWCVGTPLFLGKISKGYTVRQVIVNTYVIGLISTFITFSIFGSLGIYLHETGSICIDGHLTPTQLAIEVLSFLPWSKAVVGILILCIILFFVTTLDALTYSVSFYSAKKNPPNGEPGLKIRTVWALLFVTFPIALIFIESFITNLQTISMIMGIPIGLIVLLILISLILKLKTLYQKMIVNK